MKDKRIRINRKIFKKWARGGYGSTCMPRCDVAQYALNRGDEIVLTMDGMDFSRMKEVDGKFVEMCLDHSCYDS